MKISVTQRHIDRASTLRHSERLPECCPIALALIDAGYTKVKVYGVVYGVFNGVYTLNPLTEKVREFIDNFDNGLPVQPFEFEMSNPESGGGSSDLQ